MHRTLTFYDGMRARATDPGRPKGELLLFLPGATLSVDDQDLIRNGEMVN